MAHYTNPPEASSLKLTEHRVLIFDVYGTLIDWESAIHDAFAPLFPGLARKEILENYAAVEGRLQIQFQTLPYSNILELAYRELTALPGGMATTGITEGEWRKEQHASASKEKEEKCISSDDAQRFGRSIADWKPFNDTVDALHRLKKHFGLVVLSNVDDRSFEATHEKLCSPSYPGSAYRTVTSDSPFSLVLTAQQVGAYKPNPLMLERALRQLSARPDPSLPSNPSVMVDTSHVLVVANSVRHDIIPALQRKTRSVWISRRGVNFIGNETIAAGHNSGQEGVPMNDKHPYTWCYETLGTMADAADVERQLNSVLA